VWSAVNVGAWPAGQGFIVSTVLAGVLIVVTSMLLAWLDDRTWPTWLASLLALGCITLALTVPASALASEVPWLAVAAMLHCSLVLFACRWLRRRWTGDP